jgi:hypothetical protein
MSAIVDKYAVSPVHADGGTRSENAARPVNTCAYPPNLDGGKIEFVYTGD